MGRGLEGAVCRIRSPFSSLAETYADNTEEGRHHTRGIGQKTAATTTVGRIRTDVLFVRFLQEERLQRSRRLLHQGLDDLVQVGTGNLDEEIKLVSNLNALKNPF